MIYLLIDNEEVDGSLTGKVLPRFSTCYPGYHDAPLITEVYMLTGHELMLVREMGTYHNIGDGPCPGWENGPCADSPLTQVTTVL